MPGCNQSVAAVVAFAADHGHRTASDAQGVTAGGGARLATGEFRSGPGGAPGLPLPSGRATRRWLPRSSSGRPQPSGGVVNRVHVILHQMALSRPAFGAGPLPASPRRRWPRRRPVPAWVRAHQHQSCPVRRIPRARPERRIVGAGSLAASDHLDLPAGSCPARAAGP